MHYQLKIKDLDYLKNSFAGFGALLVEKNPDVEFTSPCYVRPIESYLWYPIDLPPIPNVFDDYLHEKLAVTDPVEAQYLIDNWNTKFIKSVKSKRQFNIGKKRFLEFNSNIVMTNYYDRPGYIKAINAGSGYLWWYMPKIKLNDDPGTHEFLSKSFGLYTKYERNQFIKKWY